jgi:hypothetical protein
MSGENFKIKPIHEDSIPEALRKAERYRLLGEPVQSESICRDILHVRPDHQEALVAIILALTDQFKREWGAGNARTAAREYVDQLTDDYERLYYGGLVRERAARSLLRRGNSRVFAYDGLREAMELYERAERVRPEGNDDAILRWNSCVRTIRQAGLRPHSAEEEPLLLE